MKTIYSLKEFHEKASQVSGVEPYLVQVTVRYGIHNEYEFSCYANGFDKMFIGRTTEESLTKMQEHIHPTTANIIDVEIDIEQPETVTE